MSRLNKIIDGFEEGLIATILAVMTLITFSQVVMRYGFNSGWGGALQFTRLLFAWLILFGMSYGLKIGSHLGVDAFIRLFPKPVFRASGLLVPLSQFSMQRFCLMRTGFMTCSGWKTGVPPVVRSRTCQSTTHFLSVWKI